MVELIVEEASLLFQFIVLDGDLYMASNKRRAFGITDFQLYTINQQVKDKIMRLTNE